MKRLLLVASLLALAVTACGGSHKATVVTARSPHAVAVAREHEAGRMAARLLRRVVLPSDARSISRSTGDGFAGDVNLGVDIFTQYEYRHAYWLVPGPLDSIVAFLKRHSPPGSKFAGAGDAETYPYQGVWFDVLSGRGRVPSRLLVSLVPAPGGTVARVDAGVTWTYPRSPREVVPAGVREIDIRPVTRIKERNGTHRVTDRRQVARIIGWFNALNVVQPNTYVAGCAAIAMVQVRFVFRSAGGAKLASAFVPSVPASSCQQIRFAILGHRQTPLIDSTPQAGMAFIDRVQRLLGVRFLPRATFG